MNYYIDENCNVEVKEDDFGITQRKLREELKFIKTLLPKHVDEAERLLDNLILELKRRPVFYSWYDVILSGPHPSPLYIGKGLVKIELTNYNKRKVISRFYSDD